MVSNCIAPLAWTRMVGTIPNETPEQQKRVEGAGADGAGTGTRPTQSR
ncbi:hypothetical protein AB5I41_08575 [Sphingomonas sp. MMS24-JH45]